MIFFGVYPMFFRIIVDPIENKVRPYKDYILT